MLCKQETHGDPRACLKVGAAVSDCASEYFTAAINRCGEGIRFDPGHRSGEVEYRGGRFTFTRQKYENPHPYPRYE